MNGYTGKILRVNLTNSTFQVEEPKEDFYRRYLGGTGFITYFLLKELKPGTDPLGPDNKLIFATGPLTGVPVSGTGRNSVGAKSPLTGGLGNAEVGGFWCAEVKYAGFDAIIIEGKAKSPVYLWIENGKLEIKDAAHLWGKETKEVQDILKQTHGSGTRVCQIGPAGERLARLACVVNDLNHAAGRCGMGAVMGSKNLRAVVVRGHQKFPYAREPEALAVIKRLIPELKANRTSTYFHTMGTAGIVMALQTASGLPTRNFQQGQFEGAEKISGEWMNKTILKTHRGCFACTVRCKPEVAIGDPYHVIPEYGGPEYETIGAFGSSCGIDSLPAIAKANQLCTANGLDTIGTGVTIAFAMECFERGLLTKKDTDGIELNFGNADAMLQMLENIINRKGLGNILAEGTARAAKKIGKDAEAYAIHVKGQELPMHEPRFKAGLGIGYAISHTGADHCHNIHDSAYTARTGAAMQALGVLDPLPSGDLSAAKVRMLLYGSLWQHVLDSLVFCQFVPLSVDNIVELVRPVTGWNTNVFELMKTGERAVTMARVFNNREGMGKADDNLPKRLLTPFTSGPLKGVAPTEAQVRECIDTYYAMMGWDMNGVPTPAKLEELGIGWATKV
jgi:aldehyde:ferredoxin oxidoreductase